MDGAISKAVRKFFSPKEEVYDQWFSSADNFEFLTADFYRMIESELAARKVPGLKMSRVEFSEGGLLSDKREYLRLQRERLVFDICAAPFGTSYFFSFRFVELPLGIKPLELIVLLVGLSLVIALSLKVFGVIAGTCLLFAFLGVSIYVMRNAIGLGLKDLDASLLRTPVIGVIYEVLFRKETYYRQDTRMMYLATVNGITKSLADEVTAAKGIKLVRQYGAPSFGDLYEERKSAQGASEMPPDKAA